MGGPAPRPGMDAWTAVVTGLWAMLPAYVPNNAAVVVGGGRPVDGGRTLGGRRLLGDGKTWRGTAGGIVAGVVLAVGLDGLAPATGDLVGLALPGFPPLVALALPAGAMLGDVLASFLKRRTGRQRGAAAPLLDQLDFVVGALVAVAVVAPAWVRTTFTLEVVVAVLVVTPLLHLATNVLAYVAGLKAEPW